MEKETFTLNEKIAFYKKKWLREHLALMVLMVLILIALTAAAIIKKSVIPGCAVPVCFIIFHCIRHNRMMTYVEKNAFD